MRISQQSFSSCQHPDVLKAETAEAKLLALIKIANRAAAMRPQLEAIKPISAVHRDAGALVLRLADGSYSFGDKSIEKHEHAINELILAGWRPSERDAGAMDAKFAFIPDHTDGMVVKVGKLSVKITKEDDGVRASIHLTDEMHPELVDIDFPNPPEPDPDETDASSVSPKSLWNQLSDTDKAAVLAYDGPVGSGANSLPKLK